MKRIKALLIICLSLAILSGCNKKEPIFSAETTIHYSDGENSDWSYTDLRKEFPYGDSCYARISSTVKSDSNKGKDAEIEIIYRFTGTENCHVEVADGNVTEINTKNENTKEFKAKIKAGKDSIIFNNEKNAIQNIVVFRYDPLANGSVILEVIYDDVVDQQYDKRSTVYFTEPEKEKEEDTTTLENDKQESTEESNVSQDPSEKPDDATVPDSQETSSASNSN